MKNNLTPQDLRVGNLFELLTTARTTKFPLRTGVNAYINEIRQEKVQMRLVDDETKKETLFVRGYNEILPIKITEELLLEFGFTGSNGYYHDPTISAIEFYTEKEILVCDIYDRRNENIKYIHQLQNIHKDLTQKELSKNEPN